MVNTEIRLIIFFAVKDGETLYSQQKQDQELTGSDHVPGVTSVFFSSCDSVVGDSLEFNQANRVSLRV